MRHSRPLALLSAILGTAALAGCGSTTSTNTTNAAASTPKQEPHVTLHLNQGSFAVTGPTATLSGTVEPGARLTLNSMPVAVNSGGKWSTVAHLTVGANQESLEASMSGDQSTSQLITVTRNQTPAEKEAAARARREREARERARHEAEARKEKEQKEVEERKERAQKEIEDASVSEQQALKSAENYLQTSSFSEAGLIEQLSSEAGSKFPHADAVWAVEHLHVNWNEQAVKSAKSYLSTSSFSCEGLVEQLDSEAGSKFTQAQAEYAAKAVGLC